MPAQHYQETKNRSRAIGLVGYVSQPPWAYRPVLYRRTPFYFSKSLNYIGVLPYLQIGEE